MRIPQGNTRSTGVWGVACESPKAIRRARGYGGYIPQKQYKRFFFIMYNKEKNNRR